MPADSVDALLASWAAARPDLDMSPVAVVNRLLRVRAFIDRELDRVFDAYDLTAPSFAVLVTLTRIGGEGGVSQKRLADELGLTAGTVSVRIDRLVEQGLVRRDADPDSKRSVQVSLTAAGRRLFERVVPVHLANEDRLLAALDADEREQLAALLRKLLVELEGADREAAERLGVALEPAHVAIRRRAAVGLAPAPGLLVRAVRDGGPAERAGVEPGDVLLRADGIELRSTTALDAALDAGHPRLTVLRGDEEREIRLL
jgi:DNA-binding MarR family transcriptional regulator